MEEEIRFIEMYLKIEKFRFRDKFEYQFNIDMEALHYKIPKMSIQPLVENACKYGLQAMDGAGLVTISASVAREYLRIVITDSGKGIEQSKLRDIILSVRNEQFSGNSFGIRNVYRRLELYYDDHVIFNIASTPNQGTTVSFEIPIRLLESREHEGGEGRTMPFKVLLIDDEPGALEGLALWIDWERLGFSVCGTAGNGVEGLKMIHGLAPDLVITDVNMPLMDGLHMIETWQEHHRDSGVKFAIMSGYSEFEYARKALRHGIHHYMLKPIIAEEAEEELGKIHTELMQEHRRLSLSAIAKREEDASLIMQTLLEMPLRASRLSRLQVLSSAHQEWNVCLIQAESALFPDVRKPSPACPPTRIRSMSSIWNRTGLVWCTVIPLTTGSYPQARSASWSAIMQDSGCLWL